MTDEDLRALERSAVASADPIEFHRLLETLATRAVPTLVRVLTERGFRIDARHEVGAMPRLRRGRIDVRPTLTIDLPGSEELSTNVREALEVEFQLLAQATRRAFSLDIVRNPDGRAIVDEDADGRPTVVRGLRIGDSVRVAPRLSRDDGERDELGRPAFRFILETRLRVPVDNASLGS